MAIGNYGQLKTAVSNWMHRSDLTDIIPDFVSLAEARIARDIRCRAMYQQASGSLSAITLAQPTGYLEAVRVVLNNTTLRYVTPDRFYSSRQYQTDLYTIEGQSFVFQSASGDYQIDYYGAFTPFSDEADANWLLTNYPDIYLFAALHEATVYVGGNAQLLDVRYQQGRAALMRAERSQAGSVSVVTMVSE